MSAERRAGWCYQVDLVYMKRLSHELTFGDGLYRDSKRSRLIARQTKGS